MQCSHTPVERVIDFSQITAGVGGRYMCKRRICEFVMGIRGPRENPVSFKQINNWVRTTPEEFVDSCLNDLIEQGSVVIARASLGGKAYRYTIPSRNK